MNRGRMNAEGCDNVQDEWKDTTRKSKVALLLLHRFSIIVDLLKQICFLPIYKH